MNMSVDNLGVSFGHGAKFLQTHFRTPPNRLNKTKKGRDAHWNCSNIGWNYHSLDSEFCVEILIFFTNH
jgi:hypothetical protein